MKIEVQDTVRADRTLSILLLQDLLLYIKSSHPTRNDIYASYLSFLTEEARKMLWQTAPSDQKKRISQVISYAKNRGLIALNASDTFELTHHGQKRLRTYNLRSIDIPLQEWDGNWRIVLYDIPETKRESRVQMTSKLQQMGFYMYQRSVWIHPFDCRDTVRYLASSYDIQPYVTFIEATSIDHEDKLKLHFKSLLDNKAL